MKINRTVFIGGNEETGLLITPLGAGEVKVDVAEWKEFEVDEGPLAGCKIEMPDF